MTSITITLDLDSARLVLAAVRSHGRLLGHHLSTHNPSLHPWQHRCQAVIQTLQDVLVQAETAAEPTASLRALTSSREEPRATETAISEELARTCSWLQILADREQRTYLLIEPERKPISGFQERIPYAVPLDDASPEERARVLIELHPQGR